MMGAGVDTTYRYTVVELTERWVKLGVDMIQTAGPQPIEQVMLKGKLISLNSKGKGSVSIPLDKMVPDTKLSSTTEFAFSVGDNDEMKVGATLVIGMAMKPAK